MAVAVMNTVAGTKQVFVTLFCFHLLMLQHQVPSHSSACFLQFQANEASSRELDSLKHEYQQLLEERQLNQSQVCVCFITTVIVTFIMTCYDSCSFYTDET